MTITCRIVHGMNGQFFLECFQSQNISTLIKIYLDQISMELTFFRYYIEFFQTENLR